MTKLYAKIKGARAISLFDFPKTWQVWIEDDDDDANNNNSNYFIITFIIILTIVTTSNIF